MDPTAIDRATRGHQGLGRDLSAEGALALPCGVLAAEDVDLDRLEIQ